MRGNLDDLRGGVEPGVYEVTVRLDAESHQDAVGRITVRGHIYGNPVTYRLNDLTPADSAHRQHWESKEQHELVGVDGPVEVSKPKRHRKPMTEEQRKAAAERLVKARAIRAARLQEAA